MTFSGHAPGARAASSGWSWLETSAVPAVGRLHMMLIEVILVDLPAHLIVDLGAVTYLSHPGIVMLAHSCGTAVEYGTGYRVVGARDQARQALHDSGVHEWLADSEDLGALVLALLAQPASPPRQSP